MNCYGFFVYFKLICLIVTTLNGVSQPRVKQKYNSEESCERGILTEYDIIALYGRELKRA